MKGRMAFDFDQIIDRRESDSLKWHDCRRTGVLPMWVADMDFASPPCVLQALCAGPTSFGSHCGRAL
jgi:cystathionine beta-lyase